MRIGWKLSNVLAFVCSLLQIVIDTTVVLFLGNVAAERRRKTDVENRKSTANIILITDIISIITNKYLIWIVFGGLYYRIL